MTLHLTRIQQPGRIAVDDLRIEQGQCLVICGPNGSGKSSLLRLLAGVDRPRRGQVQWQGKDLHQWSVSERARLLAWLPQRSTLSPAWTVEALVMSARYRFFESDKVSRQHARALLEQFGLGHLVGRLVHALSGGELQRVLIVSLVAQQSEFLLLDEPANHLDPQHQIRTYQALSKLWQAGQTVILVSHDVRLAQLLGDPARVRLLGIKMGRCVFDLKLADSAVEKHLEQLYEVPLVPRHLPGGLALDLLVDREERDAPRSPLEERR
jgi:iron complex transport system ATP-binding protein